MLAALPNIITLARVLAVPIIVYLIMGEHFAAAFWVFALAAVSDGVDGAIARICDARSRFGAYADPIADKALLVGVYVMLAVSAALPIWLVVLIITRDVLIVGGAVVFYVLTEELEMKPLLISKINTAAQLGLAALVLAGQGGVLSWPGIVEVLIWATAATTFASGAAYVVIWTRRAGKLG